MRRADTCFVWRLSVDLESADTGGGPVTVPTVVLTDPDAVDRQLYGNGIVSMDGSVEGNSHRHAR